MEACLAVVGLIEVNLAIWGSALGCASGVCCCSAGPSVSIEQTNEI